MKHAPKREFDEVFEFSGNENEEQDFDTWMVKTNRMPYYRATETLILPKIGGLYKPANFRPGIHTAKEEEADGLFLLVRVVLNRRQSILWSLNCDFIFNDSKRTYCIIEFDGEAGFRMLLYKFHRDWTFVPFSPQEETLSQKEERE